MSIVSFALLHVSWLACRSGSPLTLIASDNDAPNAWAVADQRWVAHLRTRHNLGTATVKTTCGPFNVSDNRATRNGNSHAESDVFSPNARPRRTAADAGDPSA
jgi:hypothetical protein